MPWFPGVSLLVSLVCITAPGALLLRLWTWGLPSSQQPGTPPAPCCAPSLTTGSLTLGSDGCWPGASSHGPLKVVHFEPQQGCLPCPLRFLVAPGGHAQGQPRSLARPGDLAQGAARLAARDRQVGFGETISENSLLYVGNRYKSHFMLYFIS